MCANRMIVYRKCIFCKDKPKFGGDGKKKQCCVLRKCQALANTKDLHPPPHCTTSYLTMDITLKTSPTLSLSAIGRAVKQVQGDGNRFFLCAIAVQIAGSEKYHLEILNMVIHFER